MLYHGRIDSKYSFVVHRIIKEGGILTTEIEDILERFPQFLNKKRKTINKVDNFEENYNEKYKNLIGLLKCGAKNIDEIIYILKINRNEVLNLLFEMQIENIIEEEIGVGYKLKKK
ncbi:MAG: hypothetical protein HFJ46_07715 [Clostridia bacterium]|nr:hypothetical protein [Clostridia bacterium]